MIASAPPLLPLQTWRIVRFYAAAVLLAMARLAPAAPLIDETFTYPDGALTNVSGGVWATHSGTAGQVDVAGGKVNLTGSESEDVNRDLGATHSAGVLYYAFDLRMTAQPGSGGDYFAHFGTSAHRDRLYARSSGSGYVPAAGNAAPTAWWGSVLALNTTYRIVVKADLDADTSTLWVDPAGEASTNLALTSTSTLNPSAFAFRQASGIGTMTVDNLRVGTNFVDVAGGTGRIALVITNPVAASLSVPFATDAIAVSGVATNAAGFIRWTNLLTRAGGAIPAATDWNLGPVALALGANEIAVTATNAFGEAATDSVSVTRLPPVLDAGDVALIGWDDANDAFAFVALAELPAGTVLRFTDCGWTGTRYRAGEELVTLTLSASLAAGTIMRSGSISNAFTWSGSTALRLSADGDQIALFHSAAADPLANPEANVFALDDTGAFEDATDTHTGGMPAGLTAGYTAVTFKQNGGSQNFMAFTNFPGRALRKTEWLTEIANSNNWAFGASGALPSGMLTVLPPPLLTALAEPANAGAVTGGGRHDTGKIVTLTAQAARGWRFLHWEDGSRNPARVYTMPAGDATVTAHFTRAGLNIIVR